MPPAVLAKVSVAGQYVAAIQVQALLRQAVVSQQPNHPRHLDLEVHGANPVLVRQPAPRAHGAPLAPRVEGVGGERPLVVVNHFRQFAAEQRKGAADADDVDRHVEAIQRQDAGLQRRGGGVRGGAALGGHAPHAA